jgi:Tol biopolymer transport system component
MPLSADTRLGPYEILGPLGAGGMGEVYRARDTRLGREVAIKVLPATLSSDPERLKRFEREARSASSLNHPNIVTIHDIGSDRGVSYIAMELVKGEPLRAVLATKAVPVRRLLQIAVQVADGLARAHASGIVHRDLKPENVMVTEDGLVKILDFGLAKLTQPDTSGGEKTQAPTVSGATEAGIILGTVGYMSPEQALGGAVDFRSDQFSLGSILYEMATGRRPFQRASPPQTLTAIIQDEPEPIATLNPTIPAPLRWIVDRCLAKEPRNRYASTDDLARELATLRDHITEATSAAAALPLALPSRGRSGFWAPAAFAAGLLVAALGVFVWRARHADEFWKNPLAAARFTRLTDWEGSELDAAISDDGKFVAFLADRDGPFDVWVTQIGSGEFLNLTKGRFPSLLLNEIRNVGFADDASHVHVRVSSGPSTTDESWLLPTMGGTGRPFVRGAVELAWSPDRTHTAYHPSTPGDPIFVADRNGANGVKIHDDKPGLHNHYPTWSPDGKYVYFVHGIPATFDMDLWRVRSTGGAAERLTNHHSRVTHPTFLDARTLLYTASRPDGTGSGIYALDLDRRISHLVSFGVDEYVSVASDAGGNRIVATVANPTRTLEAVPISERAVDESGVKRFPLPNVRAAAPRYGPDFLLYLSARGGADGLWKWKEGSAAELWKPREGYVASAPAISFDGRSICFAVGTATKGQLYLMASDGTGPHRIAEGLDVREAPSWSPDGKWIAVAATEGGAQPLLLVPVDGGPPVRIVDAVTYSPVWSPDGRLIVYAEGVQGRTWRLKGVTPDKRPVPLPDVALARNGNRYRFMPDGKSLIVMRGEMRGQNFWRLDMASSRLTQLTDLKPGFETKSFDVSPDGKQILFDRYRENSDVVLIDLPPR